jgi:hypothetical protein
MSKTNSTTATLRSGNKPQASKVEEAEPVKGAALKAAKTQHEGAHSLTLDHSRRHAVSKQVGAVFIGRALKHFSDTR